MFDLTELTGFGGVWELRIILGLILIDLGLGVSAAIKTGVFEWNKLADFYRAGILPYVLGYVVLAVAIGFVIPVDALNGLGEPINQAAVSLAWVTLTAKLIASVSGNFSKLYSGQ